MNAIPSDSSRATASIGGARSIPVTDAPDSAIRRLSTPVPHATSSVRTPSAAPASTATISESATKLAGTR